MQLLLNQSDKMDHHVWTGLMCACEYGHLEVVKLLLKYKEQGDDLHFLDASNVARSYGHKDIANLICDFIGSLMRERSTSKRIKFMERSSKY